MSHISDPTPKKKADRSVQQDLEEGQCGEAGKMYVEQGIELECIQHVLTDGRSRDQLKLGVHSKIVQAL